MVSAGDYWGIRGQKAPAWRVRTWVRGEPVSLDDLAGHVALLLFFSVSCPACMGRALPFAKRAVKEFGPRGLRVVGLHSGEGVDDPVWLEGLRAYAARADWPFPVAVDEGTATFERYCALGTPHWFLLDRDGRVVRSVFGSLPDAINRLEYAIEETLQDEGEAATPR